MNFGILNRRQLVTFTRCLKALLLAKLTKRSINRTRKNQSAGNAKRSNGDLERKGKIEGERKEGKEKLQIEGDRLPLLAARETAVAVEP